MVLGQEVVATQGESYSNANGNVNFTIGEVIISTATNGINDLTQGFHQTHWDFVGLDDYMPEINIQVYPNPTQNIIVINSNTFENVLCNMYDGQGKLVLEQKLSGLETKLHVGHLATGAYSLELIFNKEYANELLNQGSSKSALSNRKIYKLIKQ